ncbi:hypothetical protein Nstercoris_01117 [Nitrosomonas stercoris]|uniref:Uncharacterized protein n=1 Tax=Nitrosomonas stercoris TaxID=1444684 RepID=A0A4Y1YL82_9PROT|nr:hypothetical protein Nstercoris_01117 [Nitrosomonas stercoris]
MKIFLRLILGSKKLVRTYMLNVILIRYRIFSIIKPYILTITEAY